MINMKRGTFAMKVACQTIVYGNPVIKDTIADILADVKENGYDGVEVGARHFYLDRPEYYTGLLADLGLAIPALHVGGNFLDRDSVQEQVDSAGKIIDFAGKLGAPYIYLSGTYIEGKTDADYLHEASVYTQIGRLCKDAGKMLCYHNHFWEVENDSKGMRLLLDNIPADLMHLVPDVGWVFMGGADPVAFLRDNWDRVEAIHFKDFKGPRQFTELGTGLVDFPAVMALLKEKGFDGWISAEQDVATSTPHESSLANCRYIHSLLGA